MDSISCPVAIGMYLFIGVLLALLIKDSASDENRVIIMLATVTLWPITLGLAVMIALRRSQ